MTLHRLAHHSTTTDVRIEHGGAPEVVYVTDPDLGSDSSAPEAFTHRQVTPASTWVVDHGLGYRPTAWSLYDTADRERAEYLIEHPTVNRVVVRMDVPIAGTLYLI